MSETKTPNNVWWLAKGSSSRSRQPSFAPRTARPVVSTSSYAFGWNRNESCFMTSSQHDLFSSATTKVYPCDRSVALGMLWQCAQRAVVDRFWGDYYGDDADDGVFFAAGYMFGITRRGRESNASLHFYSPAGDLCVISFHDGMTSSFRRAIAGKRAVEIDRNLR